MAISKLVNLLAVTTLAILALSTSPEPVSALSLDNHVRHVPRHHGSILRNKKRAPADSRRCRPRSGPGNTDSSPEPATSSTDSGPLSTFAPPADPISTPGPAASVDPGSNNGGNNDQQDDGNQQVTPPQEQPTPTPQAPPPFVPAPPPPSGGRGKAGLAWGIDDPFALSNMVSAKVSRVYTWSPYLARDAKSLGIEPIPMFWGPKQIPEFVNLVVQGYASTVLGFNEPNQHDQSGLRPQEAADYWRLYINPLANQGYRIVSSACTNAPDAVQWHRDFFAYCPDCRVDVMAAHVYATNAQVVIDHLNLIHDNFGKNVWLTEFACQNFGEGPQCDGPQISQFMAQSTSWMDATDWVEAYFWFGNRAMNNVNYLNLLLGDDGYPTSLGRQYIGQ